jgi:hypothetical protein
MFDSNEIDQLKEFKIAYAKMIDLLFAKITRLQLRVLQLEEKHV